MTIKRYIANKDTTITNAYQDNSVTRAVNANMGKSDSLEVFHLYNQVGDNTREQSRILVQFPVNEMITDRELDSIPASGSVQFLLKLSNVEHPQSVPTDFSLVVHPLSIPWDEGLGLDMEEYTDIGQASWISASTTQAWTTQGGDYYEEQKYSQYFTDGTEDLEIDITDLVEQWITGSLPNYGAIIKMSASIENGQLNYYTKKFSARSSEYFYKRPWIEARYDATVKDDRGRFYLYNPFVPLEATYGTIYIYNLFRGKLYDLPTVGSGPIYVKIYSSQFAPLGNPLTVITGSSLTGIETVDTITGSWVSTGIYKATFAINTTLEKVYDVWYDSSGQAIGIGGDIKIVDPDGYFDLSKRGYSIAIDNFKPVYNKKEEVRFQLFIRPDNWNPNSYTSLITKQESIIFDDIYFKVFRIADNLEVISYGIGDTNHTRLSHDTNGNYMNLSMSMLEPGYMYGIKFGIKSSGIFFENEEIFKFRVEE